MNMLSEKQENNPIGFREEEGGGRGREAAARNIASPGSERLLR